MQEVIGTFYSNILTIHTCTHTLQKFTQNVLISEKKNSTFTCRPKLGTVKDDTCTSLMSFFKLEQIRCDWCKW